MCVTTACLYPRTHAEHMRRSARCTVLAAAACGATYCHSSSRVENREEVEEEEEGG